MAPSARIAPSEGEKSGNVSRGSTVSRSDEDAKTSHNVSFPQSLGPSEVQSLRPSEPPPVEVGADEVSLQALQVDPQGVQNFFASRARAPLDLQVTFDTVSVQLERLITSHREMMASLQTVQAEQAVLKREMESRR